MKKTLPEGFEKLLTLVLNEDKSRRAIPSKTEEIWSDFAYCILLGENRSDAEVGYLYDLLDSRGLLDLDVILKLQGKWKQEVEDLCGGEMLKVSGRRYGVLARFLRTQNLWDTTQCIVESANYFVKRDISHNTLLKRTSTPSLVRELIAEIAHPSSHYHIRNVGLTKTILWLHALGLASDHCPPSRQSRAFIFEDVENQRGPIPQVEWDRYYPWLEKVENLANNFSVTVRDISKVAWYYKCSQSLVARFRTGLKWRLTPEVLVRYVEESCGSLSNYAKSITDIDEIDNLSRDLRTFVKAI